jgi:HlyD family secretion protein
MTTIQASPAPSSDFRNYASLGAVSVAVVFGVFGGFAARAPLDAAAIASGRVAAESSTKPIQHLEGGIVREILVKEAQAVKEGDVLFRLEPVQAKANNDTLLKQYDAALALEVRLAAEREGGNKLQFPADLLARRSVPETASAIQDQERQFAERRLSMDNQVKILKAREAQTTKELSGVERQETALKEQVASIQAEITNVTGLMEKGLYTKSKMMANERERSRLQGMLAGSQADRAKLNEVIGETRLQIGQTEQKFREDAAQLLTDVRGKLSDIREKMNVASDVMNRVEIKAQQTGIVQGIKVSSAGSIVKPGESIADLVPTGEKLVMAVKVSPFDIDSVAIDQQAEVRFPGFASRGFPTIMGKVVRVAADATLDETTKEPFYMARVVVNQETLPEEVSKRLQPGMPADVLIRTGERTMLQYILGPLTDIVRKAMRER